MPPAAIGMVNEGCERLSEDPIQGHLAISPQGLDGDT
jgi:hypothetical protein